MTLKELYERLDKTIDPKCRSLLLDLIIELTCKEVKEVMEL